jgi:hypothetical protein
VLDNFDTDAKRLESFAIDDVNLRAAAKLTGKFLEVWLEIVFAKKNAGQLQIVEMGAKFLRIDKWRAKNLEWSGRAASLGNICAFEQTHTRVNRGALERRHIG